MRGQALDHELAAGHQAVDSPRAHAGDGVDDDHRLGVRPGVHQAARLALADEHLELRRALAHELGNQRAGGIVAAQAIAKPDHEWPRRAQPRSIRRRRKWVEHEMHGS